MTGRIVARCTAMQHWLKHHIGTVWLF